MNINDFMEGKSGALYQIVAIDAKGITLQEVEYGSSKIPLSWEFFERSNFTLTDRRPNKYENGRGVRKPLFIGKESEDN